MHLAGATVRRHAWSNVPAKEDLDITICEPSNRGGPAKLALDVEGAIEGELKSLGAVRLGLPISASASTRRVLIYVADGSSQIDAAIERAFSAGHATILSIVDDSLTSDPPRVLPNFIRTRLAEKTISFDVDAVVPRLLRGTGIVKAAVRLFISYRHADSGAVAEALFHELAKRGFSPFLDRYSSQPGDDFLELIEEELADKACLISLVTKDIRLSTYCRDEVAVAVSRHMGMIAVDLPDSRGDFLAIRKRIDMRGSAWAGQSGVLDTRDIKHIADRIERLYPVEALRRPRKQHDTLVAALGSAGRSYVIDGLGVCSVSGKKINYLAAMSADLPAIGHFMDFEARRQALSLQRAMVFGPVSAARPARSAEIHWLEGKSGVDVEDEGLLSLAANTL